MIDPVSLIFCKLKLALTLPHEKRQDVAHLKILLFCVRGFLREFLHEVERGDVTAQGWLGAANQMLKLAKSSHGRKAAREFGIRWLDVLPLAEIAQARNQKVLRFRESQLPRWPQ